MKFYTHFTRIGNNIAVRGYRNGKRFAEKAEYNPTLYMPSRTPTEYRTLEGQYVAAVQQGTMRDATEFIKQYEDVGNFKIYGSTSAFKASICAVLEESSVINRFHFPL